MPPRWAWCSSGSCWSSPCCGSRRPRERRASYEQHPEPYSAVGRDAPRASVALRQMPAFATAMAARLRARRAGAADDLPAVLDGGLCTLAGWAVAELRVLPLAGATDVRELHRGVLHPTGVAV